VRTTLFVVASKSGTTTETLSHFAHFWSEIPDGSHFVAITDPGTPLEELAKEHGFRRAFLANPNIGGRYSALSHFGMVNAALVGADLDAIVEAAKAMDERCRADVTAAENPGLWLGATLGEAHNAGRDKVTVFPRSSIA